MEVSSSNRFNGLRECSELRQGGPGTAPSKIVLISIPRLYGSGLPSIWFMAAHPLTSKLRTVWKSGFWKSGRSSCSISSIFVYAIDSVWIPTRKSRAAIIRMQLITHRSWTQSLQIISIMWIDGVLCVKANKTISFYWWDISLIPHRDKRVPTWCASVRPVAERLSQAPTVNCIFIEKRFVSGFCIYGSPSHKPLLSLRRR